jgi:hypothetical protein
MPYDPRALSKTCCYSKSKLCRCWQTLSYSFGLERWLHLYCSVSYDFLFVFALSFAYSQRLLILISGFVVLSRARSWLKSVVLISSVSHNPLSCEVSLLPLTPSMLP